MLRGCLLSLAMLAGLMGGYYYWLDQVFEPPGSVIGGGVAGFLVLCCFGAFAGSFRAWRDWARLSSVRFDLQPVDGQLYTVSGRIHPVRDPLIAPFSHIECVMCEYDIASQQRVSAARAQDNSNSGSDYTGFLMVPCVIRNESSEIRLLGFPLLEGFHEIPCGGYAAARNARDFITATEFEDRTGVKLISLIHVFGDVWTDDDGLVQKNMRLGKVTVNDLFPPSLNSELNRLAELQPARPQVEYEEDPTSETSTIEDDDEDSELADSSTRIELPKLSEKRVPVGIEVSAIGIYNEMLGGLVPPGRGGPPNRLIHGNAEQILNRSWSAIFTNFFGGLIGLAVIHAAILGVMYAYQHSPDVIRDQEAKAIRAVATNDVAALSNVIRRGADVNLRDSEGRTLLMQAEQLPVAEWLIQHGADVNAGDKLDENPLIIAARFNRTDIVKLLIAAKANPSPLSKKVNLTPLGEAQARGDADMAQLLQSLGAKE